MPYGSGARERSARYFSGMRDSCKFDHVYDLYQSLDKRFLCRGAIGAWIKNIDVEETQASSLPS
jgi:hypothetical protein